METTHYDAIIIGLGQGGGPLATDLVMAGRKVALIEREHAGGTCINEGCTPTKTMVASARVAYLARRAADYGVQTGLVTVDLAKVRQRKRDIVASWSSSGAKRIEKGGVDLIWGEASFRGPKELHIRLNTGGEQLLSADQIFINTGARPSQPTIAGIETVPWLNSTSIMELEHVPEHLLVIGGGYIGLEFCQMFRRFGSEVTVVQRAKRLLGREDEDIADAIAEILRQDGIQVLLETMPLGIKQATNSLALEVESPEGRRTIIGSHVLCAIGRQPNTDKLNLEAAGVTTDKSGFIQVNERLETSVSGIYALGDVKGGPAFTHISYDDYRILRTNLLETGSRTTQNRAVPYVVFTDPQLGHIGLSEHEACQQGRAIRIATLPMSSVARALEMDEPRGLMKAIVDAQSDQILGFTMLGIEGGELLAAIQFAMMGKLPYTALRDATIAHPTLAEAFNNLFADLR